VFAEAVRYMGNAIGDGNTGDNYASDQATCGDCDSSRAFGFAGERSVTQGQGLQRPKDVCDSTGSLPYWILIDLPLTNKTAGARDGAPAAAIRYSRRPSWVL
jgi:hypothetical protein